MKPTLQPGLTARHTYVVPVSRTVPYLFPEAPEIATMPAVFASPSMIALMEWACVRLLNEHLDAGEGSLGIHVDVGHLAATLPGQTVTVDVKIAKVEGPKITFDVTAHDGLDKIGAGQHVRMVVPWSKFEERLGRKREKVRGGSASGV